MAPPFLLDFELDNVVLINVKSPAFPIKAPLSLNVLPFEKLIFLIVTFPSRI